MFLYLLLDVPLDHLVKTQKLAQKVSLIRFLFNFLLNVDN